MRARSRTSARPHAPRANPRAVHARPRNRLPGLPKRTELRRAHPRVARVGLQGQGIPRGQHGRARPVVEGTRGRGKGRAVEVQSADEQLFGVGGQVVDGDGGTFPQGTGSASYAVPRITLEKKSESAKKEAARLRGGLAETVRHLKKAWKRKRSLVLIICENPGEFSFHSAHMPAGTPVTAAFLHHVSAIISRPVYGYALARQGEEEKRRKEAMR